MAKILDVYFHEKIIGQLVQDDDGEMNFSYSNSWLNDPTASRISCSLPLQRDKFTRKQCRAFFNGILPEEGQRKLIAKNLGISANNDFSMLEKIGGECAGALSFISEGEKLNLIHDKYDEIPAVKLPFLLRELPLRPLLAGDNDIRLSLAGVQDKLAVYVEDEKIFIPLHNAPSTHILKPDFSVFDGVIFNEAFCLQLARLIGLSVAEAEVRKAGEIDYLLVKRYDRIYLGTENSSRIIKRIHQEDFCQALGVPAINKYQSEGGPSLKQCFDLVRAESSMPVIDLRKMIDAVIFNWLIGNCDAHGKNFSFLYSDQLQFAPLYDLICTLYYKDLSPKMAMKIGGEYLINRIGLRNFDKFADEVGIAKPEMRKRIVEVAAAVLAAIPKIEIQHVVQEGVANLVKGRCESV